MEPIFGAHLSKHQQNKICEQIRAHPYAYVAQEQVALSMAPVWDQGHLYPRSLVFRTYVLNTGSGWIAMPGGLVRVADADGEVVSMQRGGRSKDAWVLRDRRAKTSDLEDELVSLMSSLERTDSLAFNLAELQRVGGNVRERLSAD